MHAGLRREGGHGARTVAGDDLDLDAGLGELLERLLHAAAQLVAEGDEGDGLEACGQGGRPVGLAEGERLGPPGEQHHAQAARGPLRGARPPIDLRGAFRAGAQRRRHHLGRAEHVGPARLAGLEGEAAPLALGGEEGLVRRRRPLRGVRGAQRLHRAVGVGGAGGEGADELLRARLVGPQRQQFVCLHDAGRQGAGLVGTEHVDVAQRLHGVELLHQHVLAEQPDGA